MGEQFFGRPCRVRSSGLTCCVTLPFLSAHPVRHFSSSTNSPPLCVCPRHWHPPPQCSLFPLALCCAITSRSAFVWACVRRSVCVCVRLTYLVAYSVYSFTTSTSSALKSDLASFFLVVPITPLGIACECSRTGECVCACGLPRGGVGVFRRICSCACLCASVSG